MSAIVMSPGTMRPYHPFRTLALNLNCAITKGIIVLNSKEEWVANGIHVTGSNSFCLGKFFR
jgi:hypothetical protein